MPTIIRRKCGHEYSSNQEIFGDVPARALCTLTGRYAFDPEPGRRLWFFDEPNSNPRLIGLWHSTHLVADVVYAELDSKGRACRRNVACAWAFPGRREADSRSVCNGEAA